MAEAQPAAKAPERRKVKVTIHGGSEPGQQGDVFLAHNFKPYLIKRDEEVIITEEVLECLKHSMIETEVKGEDGVRRIIKIPTYSYTVAPA